LTVPNQVWGSLLHIAVDLPASIVSTTATTAIARLDMSNGVGTRLEPPIAADGARHVPLRVGLGVHSQLIGTRFVVAKVPSAIVADGVLVCLHVHR